MQLTIEIPDDLAERLRPEYERLAEIIERGLEGVRGGTSGLGRELIRFFGRGPASQEIVGFQPSTESRRRASELLEKNREGTLTPQESAELEEVSALNHWFIRIKAEARLHLADERGGQGK